MPSNDPWYDFEWKEAEEHKARIRRIAMKAVVIALFFLFIDLSALLPKVTIPLGATIGIMFVLVLLASFLLVKPSGDAAGRGV